MTTTICWNAIVKNESNIIKRCMTAMVGVIDYWVVVDTGSTDGTQDIIRDFMAEHGIPGELHERPWVNFSHNRSEALELAEEKADYILLCDADMRVSILDPEWKQELKGDKAYLVVQRTPHMVYDNIRLINGHLKGDNRYRYWGATHEYCDSIEPSHLPLSSVKGLIMEDFADGGSKLDKFERDARLLTEQIAQLEALEFASSEEKEASWTSGLLRHKDTLLTRCTFYLAQTWRDAGHPELALSYYQKRASMGGWEEDEWYALYQAAKLMEELRYPEQEVISAYLEAYERRPKRAESLYDLARYLRLKGRYALAYAYGVAALSIKSTDDLLFVHHDIYRWRIKDEVAVSAYYVGQYALAKQLNQELLADKTLRLSQETRQRLQDNSALCDQFLS